MEVRVRVPTQLRELVAGAAVVKVCASEAADGATTVAAVLDVLATQHPALERRIRDEQGSPRQHVNLFVDVDNVRDRDGLATPIRAGEELSVLPAVSGG
jgi:sulfur-carrier protein